MVSNRWFAWMVVMGALGVGCGGESGGAQEEIDSGQSSRCEPDEEVYDTVIHPLISRYCVSCHGPEPSGGAPFSLDSYQAALGPYGMGRVIDAIPRALGSGLMPPAEQPQPRRAQRQQLIDWARCDPLLPADELLEEDDEDVDGGSLDEDDDV